MMKHLDFKQFPPMNMYIRNLWKEVVISNVDNFPSIVCKL